MDAQAAISKILKVSQSHASQGSSFGASPSLMSHPQSLQPQLNEAIAAWRQGDAEPLKGIVAIMQTTNALSGKEADEILAAIEV